MCPWCEVFLSGWGLGGGVKSKKLYKKKIHVVQL